MALALGDEVTIDLELFGEPPALPETWGDDNAATFATITRGELQWQIADVAFDGGAVGEGETTITAPDGDALHGTFAGLAISTSTDAHTHRAAHMRHSCDAPVVARPPDRRFGVMRESMTKAPWRAPSSNRPPEWSAHHEALVTPGSRPCRAMLRKLMRFS